ncbi:hypothetical protein IFM89_020857 [Coptis chinensis]|uniref:Calmodulin-binding heat-shock protein n=1 Tax=Coptis chinensis TaxID=261450 RepID=A0A835MIS8_9MAGN|nr:hypothetical protein IFM89_020857 [Coptis chinensis]
MSIVCECVICLGCSRWAWKRCTYVGSEDSDTWPLATTEEIEPIPRICRAILAVYEDDLHKPKFLPKRGYGMNPDWVIKRVTYKQTHGQAPPYIIYTDHENKEIILAIRGLNLRKECDYKLLLDNKLGMQMFDGGYVHHGLLKSAKWLLDEESETLKNLWIENGSCYKLVFAGHSLGSGVAALLAVVVVNHRDMLGGIPRSMVRCYVVAPARCMSLNLAVKYADVIYSVVLQDDFLPRTPTPLEDIFKSVFCLPCIMFLVCLRDTFMSEDRKLRDPRRLYAPGRMYHIVERKFCRTGISSSPAQSDHLNVWYIQMCLIYSSQRMRESTEDVMTAPGTQRIERLQTLKEEHKDALERVVSLNVPHAAGLEDDSRPARVAEDESFPSGKAEDISGSVIVAEDAFGPSKKTEQVSGPARAEDEPTTSREAKEEPAQNIENDDSHIKSNSTGKRSNWDLLVQKLFNKSESGKLNLKESFNVPG